MEQDWPGRACLRGRCAWRLVRVVVPLVTRPSCDAKTSLYRSNGGKAPGSCPVDLSCQVATALVSVKHLGKADMNIPEAINTIDDEATTVRPRRTGVATRANEQNSVKPYASHAKIHKD